VAGQAASYYTGQAQTGGATSITLASGETNNPLNCEIAIVGGTGAGQKAKCTAWNSSSKVATTYCPQGVSGAWVTNPDSTSLYAINDLTPNIDANGRVDLGEILGTASAGTAGYVGIDWSAIHAPTTSVNLSGTTIATVTNQLTAAAIATGVWTDTTSGDFTTASSPGKIIVAQLGGAFTTTSSSIYSTASLANAPTGGSAPTVSQIATAVWQDTTAGDFTVSGSIGKSLFTGGAVPGATGGLFIAGTNAATIVTTSFTTTFTGNLTGSVGSVTGAVGSVTGNVGGNVVGSVASVTAAVTVFMSQSLGSPRALDSISDGSIQLNDALWAAVSGAAGKESVSGTTYLIQTPHTGTTIRTFTLDSGTTPTSRS
jgi:hypothetical protein